MIQYKKKKKDGLIIPSNLGNEGIDYQNGYEDGKASVHPNIEFKEITENDTYIDAQWEGGDGFNPVYVHIDTDSYYNDGYAKGKEDEAAETKKNSQAFTAIENGVFEPLTYFNKVIVNVDITTPYNNGYKAGEEAKAKEIASKAESLNVTENGTYTPSTYYKDVTVNVANVVEPVYIVFEALSDTDSVITVADVTDISGMYYSLDERATWTALESASSITLSKGSKVYFKRDNYKFKAGFRFVIKGGNVKVSGDISAALGSTNMAARNILSDYAYNSLFYLCKIQDASELLLPATGMATQCYANLFYGTPLVSAPKLPATKMANQCYINMFRETSLTATPDLPATELAGLCYRSMFEKCKSLTSAVLPATTLTSTCYMAMFTGCSNLNKVTSYATAVTEENLNQWLSSVASTGDFYNLGGATYTEGISGIPTGWTVHTEL